MSDKRMRSPSYPSMPLKEAVDTIEKMFSEVRTSSVDREVAVRTMGYSGITGRSGKVLANLIQYGLLEKAGKNEVCVTDRAVEILHPDSDETQSNAVMQAATDPELFQELKAKFPGLLKTGPALESYLLKRGFTDAAIPSAMRAYVETSQYAQQFKEYESHGQAATEPEESVEIQQSKRPEVYAKHVNPENASTGMPIHQAAAGREPTFNVVSKSHIILGGAVLNKADADAVIQFMTAMKPMLADAPSKDEPNQLTSEPAQPSVQ